MILDHYMRRPILWDTAIASACSAALVVLHTTGRIPAHKIASARDLVSDMSSAGFTASGFILTVLTILVTFKSLAPRRLDTKSASVFELFFHTGLYHTSVSIIKNCVFSVLFVSGMGYVARLVIHQSPVPLLIVFVFATTIILLSLWRCTVSVR